MTSNKTNILRLPAVIEKTGLSRSSIYAFIAKDQFPKPIKISSRISGWVEEEIDIHLQNRIEKSRSNGNAGEKL